jgi:hypothetical protein
MTEQTADTFEISPQQEELWRLAPDGPAGRLQASLTLTGTLDEGRLRGALAQVVARHEILRTTFVAQPGIRIPLQAVSDDLSPVWTTGDVSTTPPAEQAAQLAQIAAHERQQPLPPADGPLVRASLVKLGDTRHTLVLTLSTLCADASSIALLAHELLVHLTGEGDLVADPLQYADFSAWQRELRAGDDAEATAAREFWDGARSDAVVAIPF